MDGSETGRTTAALLRRHPAWTAAAAALLAVLPFLPSLGYGFLVEWDDGGFVTHNPHLALSWENLHYNLTANLQGVYTPLTALWLMIDNAVFGGTPAGFHLVNLLLYGGCAAMLCLIMRELRIPPVAAVVLTLLWAWNPCKIETVGWIAERKGLASAFLAFCAMRLFLPACRRGRPSWSAALLTFAAFFFKPWVLPLPGVMAVYAWMLYPRDFRKLLNLLGPVAAAGILGAAIVSAVTFSELSGSQKPEAADYAGLLLRYTGAAFAPLSLNPLHPAAGFARMWPEALWGAAVLGCLWAAGFANFGPKRGLRLSLAFTVSLAGLALPVLSSGSFTNTNYADRYGFLLSALLWCWAGELLVPPFSAHLRCGRRAAGRRLSARRIRLCRNLFGRPAPVRPRRRRAGLSGQSDRRPRARRAEPQRPRARLRSRNPLPRPRRASARAGPPQLRGGRRPADRAGPGHGGRKPGGGAKACVAAGTS